MTDEQKPQQFYVDDEKLVIRPWSELDDEPDRDVLVPDILFAAGVSSVVSAPGGGKTTFAVAVAMTVHSGGMWAGTRIKPRPVLWIVADDKGTLKSTRKIWLKENPGAVLADGGGWIDGPVDLSDAANRVRELREWLKGKPPMLIVIDMLADCFGDLDDERAKDAIKIYKQIWRIVREHGSTFLNLQHTPWGANRPKGSIAMPGKNDIILIINELNVAEGYIKLEHFKRREGPMLKDMAFVTRLVELEGKPHPLPYVTGRLKDAVDLILNVDWAAAEEGARQLVQIVMQWPEGTGKPTYTRLMERSGMEASAYERARAEAVKVKTWLTGGGKGGYLLNPNGCWREALASVPDRTGLKENSSPSSSPSPSTLKGVEGEGRRFLPSLKEKMKVIEGEGGSSVSVPSEEAEEALTLTLDTAALLKKIDGKMVK
jgi:hypothetical protein